MSIQRAGGPVAAPPGSRGRRWVARVGLLVGAVGTAWLLGTALDQPAYADTSMTLGGGLTTLTGAVTDLATSTVSSLTGDGTAGRPPTAPPTRPRDADAEGLPVDPPPAPPSSAVPAVPPAPPARPTEPPSCRQAPPPLAPPQRAPDRATSATDTSATPRRPAADPSRLAVLPGGSGSVLPPELLTPVTGSVSGLVTEVDDLSGGLVGRVDGALPTVLPGLDLGGLQLGGLSLPGLQLPGLELPGIELPPVELPVPDLPGLPLPQPLPGTSPGSSAPGGQPAEPGPQGAGATAPVGAKPAGPAADLSGPPTGRARRAPQHTGAPHSFGASGQHAPSAPSAPTAPSADLAAARADGSGGQEHEPMGGARVDPATAPQATATDTATDQATDGRAPAPRDVPG